ncbi:methyltransferase domain-containing protein [Bradyrhizobium sp. SYSU BS000235]|uniref:class I SAM-dependent DNA methyltransferase n=1 Tax=Bradyrhizobium sp. SYSU BS000235 TaxID=3411332 RepID=UPI003C7747B7
MSSWLFLSSGNLIADRRFDFGRDLQSRGDLSAAADLMMQAVELEPGFASAWFSLGELREQLGEREQAVDAYRRARGADPADKHGAKLRLMRLGAEELSGMPEGYVAALFDQYAPKFDKALVDDLNYRGPQVLLEAVLAARPAGRLPARFRRAIDLGCGTGLAAQEFASVVDEFIGIDLSSGMIERARASGLYARLDVADMLQGLQAESDASADLVMAADAFVYVPDLAPIVSEAARVLQPQGLLAFTVEAHSGEGIVLGRSLRYAHSADYLRATLEDAGLTACAITPVSTRMEAGEAVPGFVVTASKS